MRLWVFFLLPFPPQKYLSHLSSSQYHDIKTTRLVVNWDNFSFVHFVFPGVVSFFCLVSYGSSITILTPNFLPMVLIQFGNISIQQVYGHFHFLTKKKKSLLEPSDLGGPTAVLLKSLFPTILEIPCSAMLNFLCPGS